MAVATRRRSNAGRKPNTSAVKNPTNPGRRLLVGGRSKSTRRRGTTSRRRNPTTAIRTRRRTSYRRNPSETVSGLMFAAAGALVINGFDEVVNRFAPSMNGTIRIIGKAGAGYAIGNWGKKFLGSWATIAQNALWLAAALDVFQTYIRPALGGYLTSSEQPAVVATQPVQNTTTGQLGQRLFLDNGNTMDVFDDGMSQYAY